MVLSTWWIPAVAQQNTSSPDLSTTSLEDLTRIQLRVSSFARKDQDLWVTPAAVFVITREDIERSDASSIPELLRMVPGLQVAQIQASSWAVSARGFNSAYASKLLVLVDGRTVYSEIYSGEHWDQNDVPLREIERIEVIRGPGAAVWGTDALNGVINIITKRARSTQGLEVSAQSSRIGDLARIRYGGSLGDRLQYRGDAFYRNRRALDTVDGKQAFDGEDSVRAGGRVDWQNTRESWLTLSGDINGGHLKQQLRSEFAVPTGPNREDFGSIAGGYLLGRFERKLAHSESAFHIYFDDTSRHELGAYARTRTFDSEYQDHRPLGERNDLVWGAGFRLTGDHIAAHIPVTTLPEYKNYLVYGFVQDQWTLKPNRLFLTLGSKIQKGTLAGFQVQPSLRAVWSPTPRQSLWGALSRAAVAPSIQDRAIAVPLNFGLHDGLPVTGTLQGDPKIKAETVIAYEVGFRQRVLPHLTLDIATFFNDNRRLQSLTIGAAAFVPSPLPHIRTDLTYGNGFRAKSAGAEVAVLWKPTRSLSFTEGYTWMQVHEKQTLPGEVGLSDTWSTPRNSFLSSASWEYSPRWSISVSAAYTGALPRDSPFSIDPNIVLFIPAFERLDLHLERKIGRNFEVSAGGTNLLTPHHLEFAGQTDAVVSRYVPRSFSLSGRWKF